MRHPAQKDATAEKKRPDALPGQYFVKLTVEIYFPAVAVDPTM
jgi:hypothetical protein